MGDCGGGGGRGVVWVDECKESSYYLHRFYILVRSRHTGGMVECGGIGEWACRPGDV